MTEPIAPTAPSGEAQTGTIETLRAAIETLDDAVYEHAYETGRDHPRGDGQRRDDLPDVRSGRIAADARAALAAAFASLSTERARMEREVERAGRNEADALANLEASREMVAFLSRDTKQRAAEVSRLTSELDRVRGALDAAVDSIDWRHSPKCNGNSLSGGCSCGLRRFRALRATALSGLSTPDATTKEGGMSEEPNCNCRGHIAKGHFPNCTERVPVRNAEWDVTRLRSALENYGQHHGWCAFLVPAEPRAGCNCGLVDALNIGRLPHAHTNDPTAPRVVGDPSIPRDEVHFVVDGKTVGKIVGLDPAPRVVGGGDADALRKAFVDGYVKALGAEDDPWVRGHAELEAKEYPAVLPEEGTTPLSEEGARELLAERETRPPMTPQRAAMLERVARAAVPALRESGAGRGLYIPTEVEPWKEAAPLALVTALNQLQHIADAWEMADPMRQALQDSAQRGWDALRAASSGESGAPTEELTEADAYYTDPLRIELTATWLESGADAMNGKGDALQAAQFTKAARTVRALASRLTRSPRAAGESTAEARDDDLRREPPVCGPPPHRPPQSEGDA